MSTEAYWTRQSDSVHAAPAEAEGHVTVAPLAGLADVLYPLAGENHDAHGGRDRLHVLDVSRDGRGRRLVEATHAVRHLAEADHRQPFDRQTHHLQVEQPEIAASSCARMARRRICSRSPSP